MQDREFVTSALGVRMPTIIYGTAWKKERTAELVARAVKLGFRGIDTACQPKHYDEAGVGAGLAEALKAGIGRSDLFLQTKFTALKGQDPERVPYDAKAPLAQQVAQSFTVSLTNLGTDYLDSLVLHSPMANGRETLKVWRAMEALFHSGQVRQLGISNCYRLGDLETLYRKSEIKPAVIQNRFYAETGYDQDIRRFCRNHQIIYQSFWSLTANPKLLAHDAVKAMAKSYQRTTAQIFFRYLIQNDVVPLTGTTSPIHMQEDLETSGFELTNNDCDEISALLAVQTG